MSDLNQFKRHLIDELTPDRHEHGKYICPICGSGDHIGGDGAFSLDRNSDPSGNTGHCFSCGFHGDIFDLYEKRDGLTKSEAARAIREKYGSSAADFNDGYDPGYTTAVSKKSATPPAKAAILPTGQPRTVNLMQGEDWGQFYGKYADDLERWHYALLGSEGEKYLTGCRGISRRTMIQFRMGYDAEHNAVTIPYNPQGDYYSERSIDSSKGLPHMNPKGGKKMLFNPDALYTDAPCFVVESALCAISIEQMGARAVALGGAQSFSCLMEQIEYQKPTAPALIISLDNDDPGEAAAEKLAQELNQKGIFCFRANISDDQKDPNAMLVFDSERLRDNVVGVIRSTFQMLEDRKAEQEAELEAQKQEYAEANAAGLMDDFLSGVSENANTPAIPTGFPQLDDRLGDGLYEGLYCIGAISSAGKTTFIVQIADQIAASGRDVLYISLEMSRYELIAKSISRLTNLIAQERNEDPKKCAQSTRGILAGKRYDKYSQKQMDIIAAAVDRYKATIGGHIWIEEGIGDIGVEQIQESIERHIKLTGRKPVVFIDYLQILAPADVRATDKANTDKAVLTLKRISRDHKIPIFCVSSFNRDNYTAPVNMASFKESGAIEYSSDVLLGIQYQGMDYQEGEADKAREKRIRELKKKCQAKGAACDSYLVELKILKNRNGAQGGSGIPYLFNPAFNTFVETVAGFVRIEDDDEETPFDTPNKKPIL